MPKELNALTDEIAKFAIERDWEQFHTPRNLILALVGEIGELANILQWKVEMAEVDPFGP